MYTFLGSCNMHFVELWHFYVSGNITGLFFLKLVYDMLELRTAVMESKYDRGGRPASLNFLYAALY